MCICCQITTTWPVFWLWTSWLLPAASCQHQPSPPSSSFVQQVFLQQLMERDDVRSMLGNQIEVAANLDQNPQVMSHFGSDMPTLLASMSNMYALLRQRLFTATEIWLNNCTKYKGLGPTHLAKKKMIMLQGQSPQEQNLSNFTSA